MTVALPFRRFRHVEPGSFRQQSAESPHCRARSGFLGCADRRAARPGRRLDTAEPVVGRRGTRQGEADMQEAISYRFANRGRSTRANGPTPVAQRRRLATPRAAIGALLVVGAALGAIALSRPRPAALPPAYLVAGRDLAAGAVVRSGDLSSTRVKLTADLAVRAFTDPKPLIGKIVVAPLGKGELVQAGAFRAADAAPEGHELAVSLSADRIVGAALEPGDRVSVLSTTDLCTIVVAPVATIVDVARPNTNLGGGNPTIRLTVPTAGELVALVQALRTGQVTFTRGTSAVTEPTECAPKTPA